MTPTGDKGPVHSLGERHTGTPPNSPRCCFNSRAFRSEWGGGGLPSPGPPGSGARYREPGAPFCSRRTKTSTRHLTPAGDARRGEPKQPLPFKMRPRGPCPEKRHLGPCQQGSSRLLFPPLEDCCLSAAANLRRAPSLAAERGGKPVLLILLLTAHSRLPPLTRLIMLQVYGA